MKKLAISVIGLLILSMGIYSCYKDNQSGDCKTCESNDYKIINTQISDVKMSFKCFSNSEDINDVSFSYADLSENELNKVFNELNLSQSLKIGSKVISFTLYYRDQIISDLKYDKNKLEGILIYYILDNQLHTKVYELGNNVLELQDLSLTSSKISTNDMFSLCNLKFKESRALISLNSANTIYIIPNSLPQFTNYLSLNLKNKLKIDGGGSRCGRPCPRANNADCVRDKFGYYCMPGCLIRKVVDTTNSRLSGGINSNLSFNVFDDISTLTNFRDNYLYSCQKGIDYSIKYQYISDNFFQDAELPSVEYSLSIFNFIHNQIIPIVNKLQDNPESNQILYDNTKRDLMIEFLENSKQNFNDPTILAIINSLINEVNVNTNKSVYEVNNYLNQP